MQARNVNGMELREGDGNGGQDGNREGDKMNVVWIVDSDKLPFYRAEVTCWSCRAQQFLLFIASSTSARRCAGLFLLVLSTTFDAGLPSVPRWHWQALCARL